MDKKTEQKLVDLLPTFFEMFGGLLILCAYLGFHRSLLEIFILPLEFGKNKLEKLELTIQIGAEILFVLMVVYVFRRLISGICKALISGFRRAKADPDQVEEDGDSWERFENHYECPNCYHDWICEDDCKCDEECPECGLKAIEPHSSLEITRD